MAGSSFKAQSEASKSGALSAAIAGLALIGSCLLGFATRWGIGLYTDSIVYVGTARNILTGAGVVFFDDVGRVTPVVQYPPLYPAIVAAGGMIGLDPLESARWLSVGFYGANAVLAAYIVYSSTSSHYAALLATWLALTGFPMIYIHSQALTEPMFIFLIFSGFAFLERYLRRPRPWLLFSCALCIGLSCLARYVGIAYIITVAAALLWLSRSDWRRRFADALVFGAASSLPLALWILRNIMRAGDPVNRTFSFHPPALRDFLPMTDTIGYWLMPIGIVDGAPWLARPVVGLVFLALLWLAQKADLSQTKFPRLLRFGVAGYGLFLLTSWSFNDQPLFLDTRTMALPYLGLMMLTLCIITDRLRQASRQAKPWRRFTVDCLLIAAVALQTINGAVWLQQSYFDGIGFATEQWRRSELLRFVKDTKEPTLVFSNAPDYIYTLTGKAAFMVPNKVDPISRRPNERFQAETAAMGAELEKRNAVLIYFNDEDRLWYLPSIKELEAQVPLKALKIATDGTIYGLKNTAAVGQR